jgi:hypothetical protein
MKHLSFEASGVFGGSKWKTRRVRVWPTGVERIEGGEPGRYPIYYYLCDEGFWCIGGSVVSRLPILDVGAPAKLANWLRSLGPQ